jgi:phospho-N-acetylmuramoyl-pentapeptide-transferase
MGGLLIWFTTCMVSLPFFLNTSPLDPKRGFFLLPLFTLVAMGIIGAIDDYFNIRSISIHKGLAPKVKILLLTSFSLMAAAWFYYKLGYSSIHIPAMGDFSIGVWYIPLFAFIIISCANAVNITDGLDGLAGGLLITAYTSYAIIAYAQGLVVLSILCSIIIGALISFLWFNIPPARFFMGDTGSLSLGATLGVIAMLTNTVLILPIIISIFVLEVSSSAIQMFSKKVFNRKVFPIAPFHHTLEHKGWPEHKITMRLWLLGAVSSGIGTVLALVGSGDLIIF